MHNGISAAPPWWFTAFLTNEFATLQTEVGNLKTQMGDLKTQVAIENARNYNSSATFSTHELRPVPNAQNEMPAETLPPVWFPATVADFGAGSMTQARANELCNFYGIPVGGNTEAQLSVKARKIKSHIGVRL